MAYELSIERDHPLTIEEWEAAVRALPHLSYGAQGIEARNPSTGEIITMPGQPGNVSMAVGGVSTPVFWWRNGRAVFPATADRTVIETAFRLAQALRAEIRGEEGEVYPSSSSL